MFRHFVLVVCVAFTPLVAHALPLPDLTIVEVKSGNLDKGEIFVRIRNVGAGPSAPSKFHVFLSAFPGQPGKTMTFSSPHPGLLAGQSKWVLINTKTMLSQVKYGIRVNGQAQIKESNFSNNARVGQFGGKP